MKKMRKRLLSTMLSVLMGVESIAGAMSVQAVEVDMVQRVFQEVEHEGLHAIDGNTMLTEQQEAKVAASVENQQDNLPSKYSSIELGYTPEVRSQAPYGNCWAHSAFACLEIAMIKDNLGSPDTLELSIPHGIYYYFRPVVDPLDGTADDYVVTDDKTVTSMLQDGGFASYIGNSTLAWQGPVLAQDFLGYTELNEKYNFVEVSEALDTEEYAYGNKAAIVTEMAESRRPNIEEMKRAIVKYGSVGINYDSDINYYNTENSAQYCPIYSVVDHAVTVVGWDDTYSKNNFKQKPLDDGAWLVRNTGGESYGIDGYFWLSYDDKSMETVTGYRVVAADTYDNNYQYYGIRNSKEVIYGKQGKEIDAVNVFEIQKEKELLKAVQFSVAYNNLDYSVQIYKNPTEDGNPLSGKALLDTPITGAEEWNGIYTVDLDQPVWLEQGDRIAVCVTFSPQHTYTSPGVEYESTRTSLPDRSFYRIEEEWIDCADVGMGNFIIRAFTQCHLV